MNRQISVSLPVLILAGVCVALACALTVALMLLWSDSHSDALAEPANAPIDSTQATATGRQPAIATDTPRPTATKSATSSSVPTATESAMGSSAPSATVDVKSAATPARQETESAPTSAPLEPTSAPSTPTPVLDSPKTDPVTVKMLVGGLTLPTGRTFRQCVAKHAPGDGLYTVWVAAHYLGDGLWLVRYDWGGEMLTGYYNERTSVVNLGNMPNWC